MRLDGARAVVTGAGSGIGRALAVALGAAGARPLLVGRRRDPLRETADLMGLPESHVVEADVTTPTGRAAVRAAAEREGGLDLLVNNAGRVEVGPLDDLDDAAATALLTLNVAAPACLIRDLLPLLRAGRSPRVVNVGSMFGDIAFPQFALYSASKFALRGLSDALRRELAPEGIAVTYVAPRGTRTPAASAFAHLVEPFGMRLDPPEAVARHVVKGLRADRAAIYPAGPERLFVAIQRLLPGRIDAALGRQYAAFRAPSSVPTEETAR